MIETRLRKESDSDLERALLDAGASYKGSASARGKTLAALGLAGSATLLAGTVGAASLSSVAKLTWTKVLLGASLVGAAAVPIGYQMWHRHQEAQAAAVVASAQVAVVSAPAPVSGEGQLSLSRELAALDAARASLAAGEARRALRLLDVYAQSYPHGRLELEAEVMRIDALAKSGRAEAAGSRAEAFLRKYPNSVLASRVRAHAHPTE